MINSNIEINFKEFLENGFTIVNNVLKEEYIKICKEKLQDVYKIQIFEFNEKKLSTIKEENTIRAPLLYDKVFLDIINNETIIKIVKQILGEYAILSLQNSIIVSPNQKHHQSFYHRDIIHQDFVTSKPIGINLYFCLDDYSEENGGTCFIPKSHKMELLPSSREEITPSVSAGSIILFDSMIYHKAGVNRTNDFRYGINNMFTLPFIKQQINIPHALSGKHAEEYPLNRLLGYHSLEHYSVLHFREERHKRASK
jgi:ectoine hydroxylase-related dioxygenase (phytanoyl-CoA dioxygenase family)